MSDIEFWMCPHCKAEMPGPQTLCSGSFLDRDHPANVQPVRDIDAEDGRRIAENDAIQAEWRA